MTEDSLVQVDESQDNICKICGGALRIAFTITFEQCRPHSLREEIKQSLPAYRLCPGHHDANGVLRTADNRMFMLESFLQDGLHAEGQHHKQWALCKIAEILGFKQLLEEVENKGIAP